MTYAIFFYETVVHVYDLDLINTYYLNTCAMQNIDQSFPPDLCLHSHNVDKNKSHQNCQFIPCGFS